MNESVIDTLLALLEEQLPALLQTQWDGREQADADRGEIVPMAVPEVYLAGLHKNGPLPMPAVMAWDEGSEFEQIGAEGWSDATTTVVVAALIASDDETTLERQLSRYRAAFYQFFATHQVLPGTTAYLVTPLRVGRESRAAQLRISAPGVRGIMWDLEVRSEERTS